MRLNRHPAAALLAAATAALSGCAGSICDEVEIAADPDVVTKLDVNFAAEGESSVEWGYDESYGNTAPLSGGEGSVLGIKPLSEVYYKVIDLVGNKEKTCEGVIDIAQVPSQVANLHVEVNEPANQSSEPYVMGSMMFEHPTLFVVDRDGDMVWYHPTEEGLLVTDARFARDSNDVLYNGYAERYDVDIAALHRISMGHDEIEETRLEWGHHFFQELPDGTIAYTAIDVRAVEPDGWDIEECDEKHRVTEDGVEKCNVVGHELVEILPNGDAVTLLSTFDFLPVLPYDDWNLGFYPQGHTWLHANALNYDDERETYMWSFAGFDTFAEIDRGGNVVRTYGDFGDIKPTLQEYARNEDGFEFQHDPHWTKDGTILMFTYDKENGCYAIEFEVDESSNTMTEIWQYGRNERLIVQALGTARHMDNGNTMVNFGSSGVLREVTPAGEVVWEGYTDSGTFFGSTHTLNSLYAGYDQQ